MVKLTDTTTPIIKLGPSPKPIDCSEMERRWAELLAVVVAKAAIDEDDKKIALKLEPQSAIAVTKVIGAIGIHGLTYVEQQLTNNPSWLNKLLWPEEHNE